MTARTIADRWNTIRVRLREARVSRGITQEEVGQRLTDTVASGERRSWVSRIESGRAVPEILTVIGLARAVDYELAVVPSQLAGLLDLNGGDAVAILRAAQAAASGRTLHPVEAYRTREVLQKIGRGL